MWTRWLFFVLALGLASAPARAEVAEVRIAVQFGLIYLPVVVAEEEGFFVGQARALGLPDLKVTMTRLSGSTAVTDGVLSGAIDLGAFGVPGLLIGWEKSRGRQRITGLAATGTNRHRLFTSKPNLKTLADFTDQDRIAAPAFSSPQAIQLRIAADRFLGSPARAEQLLVNMPHPEALAALQSGAISGYIASPPFSQLLEKNPQMHLVFSSTELFGGRDPTSVVVGGLRGFIDDNPTVARAIIAGIDEADRLIRDNPRRAAAIYLKTEKAKLTTDEVVQILTDGSIEYDAAPRGLVLYAGFMRKLGMLKAVPATWQEVFTPLLADRAGD